MNSNELMKSDIELINRMLIAENEELKIINKRIKSDLTKENEKIKLENLNLNKTIKKYQKYFSLIDRFRNSLIYKLIRKVYHEKN